ncbi:GHKL domain-containing protein [Alkalibacterium iburiense]|uniref:GHKL domain-containing protein n=1 Tax=Alkalibacterium iburiense TaxID=290589 RepID=A0ABN0XMU5_9LACT
MSPYIMIIISVIGLAIVGFGLRHLIRSYYDKKITEANATLIRSHVEEVESIYKQMRGWRHDYKNHIQAMKAYLELNQLTQLNSYLDELDEDLVSVDTLIKSGNVMMDAVLNSKLTLAQSRGITLRAKAQVPKTIQVQDVDLGIILGNLLSNAIEGCMTLENPEDRVIRVYINEMKGQLYISVTNTMNHTIRKSGNEILTTKKGKDHGFGLKRIDSTVNKYEGFINRQFEEGVFATEVTLPL